MKISEALSEFAARHKFRGKSPLCVALFVTDLARKDGLPLDAAKLLTGNSGQIEGLGKARIQAILKRHGISRTLAFEGGRTSRGSIGNMQRYVEFLNSQHKLGALDLAEIEKWWIARVQEFFAAKPLMLRMDGAIGLRATIRSIFNEAQQRQRDLPGSTFAGTLMQHLVGAKLELVLGQGTVQHESASTNDAGRGRRGDFEIGDVVIHVSNAPGEALIGKCRENLDDGFRPLIVASRKGAAVADGLAEQAGIAERIDIFEIDAWLASNLQELGKFQASGRKARTAELIERYNNLVDKYENDPSLRIEAAKKPG